MKSLKYIFPLTLLAVIAVMSCSDSDIDLPAVENPTSSGNMNRGQSLSLTVTLDAMGGRSADPNDPLWEFENYVDPERFRVLFFDSDDKFLFESKTRWVKQIASSNDNTRWYLSVPMFTYGHEENWDWVRIKDAMTSGPFKVAVLANRPVNEWCPNFDDTGIPEGWFDNTGPHWGPEHTGKKDVFDLHHAQYDPIYDGKNYDNSSPKKDVGFYNFIQGKDEQGRVAMGSTSSWVDWGKSDDAKESDPNKWRTFKTPGTKYPIPMYGIQKYDRISPDEWPEGTTFNLTRKDDKPVSLLRSVVKLELILPSRPSYVKLWYTNVYARCEPLNVWDPTDEIWQDDHDKNESCEWFTIRKYGRLSKNTDYTTQPKSGGPFYGQVVINDVNLCIEQYMERMSWFYGAWKEEKGWDWNGHEIDVPDKIDGRYPQIFNSCIQRNSTVNCEAGNITDPRDNYFHYVVYTGERDLNDPSRLDQLSNEGTVAYWMFNLNGVEYSVPLSDYFGTLTYKDKNGTELTLESIYTTRTSTVSTKNTMADYFIAIQQQTDTNLLPIPLMRNHIYRFRIGSAASVKTRSESSELAVEMQDLYTEDISFK